MTIHSGEGANLERLSSISRPIRCLTCWKTRTAVTSATWMAGHPELEIVSRDRGGDYAAAARTAAPQATQTADRFHLYKNLSEAVERTLALCRAEIRQGALDALSEEEKKAVEPLSLPTEFVSVE